MKVLMLNGSAKPNGNTALSLKEIGRQLNAEGIDYEIFEIGPGPVRDCIGCNQCTDRGCVFDDDTVNEFLDKMCEADGLVIGTPVYYAHPSGRILSFLNRAFYCGRVDKDGKPAFSFKPAASVAVARRAGTTASFDVLNKYFGISQMPVAGSTYWNVTHGAAPGQAEQDGEGLQTMRNLARNMAWMLKCIEAGHAAGIPDPATERGTWTNFIR